MVDEAEVIQCPLNNKAFSNLLCNPQKSFHTSFKLNSRIFKQKKKKKKIRLAVFFL